MHDCANSLCAALHLLESVAQWRLSTNEVLATQIEVFEESQAEDDSQMTMPGGIDLNSHEDIFNALFTKVWDEYYCCGRATGLFGFISSGKRIFLMVLNHC